MNTPVNPTNGRPSTWAARWSLGCSTRPDDWSAACRPARGLRQANGLVGDDRRTLFKTAAVRLLPGDRPPGPAGDLPEAADRRAWTGPHSIQKRLCGRLRGQRRCHQDAPGDAWGPAVLASYWGPVHAAACLENAASRPPRGSYQWHLVARRRVLGNGFLTQPVTGLATPADDLWDRLSTPAGCALNPAPVFQKADWLARHGGTVPRLARDLWEARAWHELPVLADALEEAGCAQEQALLGNARHLPELASERQPVTL